VGAESVIAGIHAVEEFYLVGFAEKRHFIDPGGEFTVK
jgi:hypothetical protein